MKIIYGTGIAVCIATFFAQVTAVALNYGAGTYGTCQYGTCSITITAPSEADVSVTPNGGATTCTVASSDITVSTGSSTGYTLTFSTIGTDTALADAGHSTSIAAAAGTPSSPAVLVANRWGYRVDGGTFGAGPTGAVTNGAVPSLTFAGVPGSSGAVTLYAQNSAANNVATRVWYGACVDITQAAGLYTNSIQYSAVIN